MNARTEHERPDGPVARAPRTVTTLVAAKLVTRHGDGLCRIRNVAPGGVMLETASELARGDRVGIELRDRPRVDGVVVWHQGARAGISFDAPVDVADLIGGAAEAGSRLRRSRQPRGPRLAVGCRVGVEVAGGQVFGTLVDISQGGAALTLPVTPASGAWLTIDMPRLGRKRALVRWIGEQVGVSFAEPLRFDVLSSWLAERARLSR